MANKDGDRLIVLGLPAMGKTTFLAALWHVVESREVAGALELVKLEGNSEYISGLREKWLNCESLGRTTNGQISPVRMQLREPGGGLEAALTLPDISGETFRAHLVERSWTPEYAGLAAEASGALLFIHPNEITEPIRIDEAAPLAEAIGAEENGGGGRPWSDADIPTQVQLIELIQFHQVRMERPLRLGIIISAWDLVETQGKSPTEWLDKTMPLLGQFLDSNADSLFVRIFGISAQGGKLEAADQLLAKGSPSQRIKVVDDGTSSNDITRPISWLLKARTP